MPTPFPRLAARLRPLPLLALLPMVAGCDMIVLDPAGDVARQQGDLIVISTVLMLLIIIPVMALTIFFAWRYRASNKEATYKPDWDHSTQLELVIWAAPLLIIICLGAITWVATHLLDPYRPLAESQHKTEQAAATKPLEVHVVALDWKWLFIYPEQGVATVNELALPINREVRFRISASSVMNSFYIPAMAGQIYAMPGMETKLHGVLDKTGDFVGFSANYSGAGFSNMRFAVKSVDEAGFDKWIAETKGAGGSLDRAGYLQLERPSEKEPVRRYAAVEPGLFDKVVNMCVEPGKMCMHDMMAIDTRGGMGIAGIHNVHQIAYDKHGARGTGPQAAATTTTAATTANVTADTQARYVASVCITPTKPNLKAGPARVDPAPLTGAGLARPGEPGKAANLALYEKRGPVSRPAS